MKSEIDIEKVTVSLFGGYMLSSLLSGMSISEIAKPNILVIVIKLIVCIGIIGAVTFKNIKNGKLVSCFVIFMFAIKVLLINLYITKNTQSKNIFLLCVLSILVISAYWYMKEEIKEELKKIKIANIKLCLILIGLFIIMTVCGVGIARYKAYAIGTYDFGIFAQMFEYMRQKGTMETTIEKQYLMSHLGRHFSLIFYLLYPIYYIFPHPETLLIAQGIMIALPIIPIYLLCKHYDIGNYNMFAIVVIYIFILGIYYIVSKNKVKTGFVFAIISCIWFAFAMTMINYFSMGTSKDINNTLFENLMYDKNGGISQIIETILSNPGYVITQFEVGGKEKIQYIIYMIMPIGLLLFNGGKKYSRYILLLPFLFINVASAYIYFYSIRAHYNYGTIAFIMFIIILNISSCYKKDNVDKIVISLIISVMMFVCVTIPNTVEYISMVAENGTTIEKMDKGIEKVPLNASVTAYGLLIPHLSKNLQLYDIDYVKTINTEYVVIDERVNKQYPLKDYKLIYEDKGVIAIYKK